MKLNRIDLGSQKVVIVEEGLVRIDMDDIKNLEDLLRVVLIDEACGNLKIVIEGRELTTRGRKEEF